MDIAISWCCASPTRPSICCNRLGHLRFLKTGFSLGCFCQALDLLLAWRFVLIAMFFYFIFILFLDSFTNKINLPILLLKGHCNKNSGRYCSPAQRGSEGVASLDSHFLLSPIHPSSSASCTGCWLWLVNMNLGPQIFVSRLWTLLYWFRWHASAYECS